MPKFDISRHAGVIYYLLEQKNSLSLKDIEVITSGDEKQNLLALGWLVRDNRIVFCSDNGELSVKLNRLPMTEIHY